jgi:multiple sugar transport system substrate-binding protein
MKKRFVALFLAVIMCLPLFLLVGCNNKKTAAGDFVVPEEGFDTSKEITVVFYHTMGANLREVLDKYIPEFNKLYPNIKIEHKQVGSYDDVRDQIKTEITVGNQPNIAYCYPDHVALYNLAKAVVPLDSLIDSTVEVKRDDGTTEVLGLTDEQKADFIKGYYEEGKQFGDGKMYTLPLSKSTEVLYYNKTFFDQHKLKVPTTWDEMEKVCEQIKKIDPDSIPLGYDSEANWFITMCEQQGSDYTSATGEHFLFDNEQNRSFVTRFRDWYQKGYVTTKELSGGYTSDLFKMDPNEKGNSYMCIGSSAGASYQRPAKTGDKYLFDVDITTVPQVDAKNPKVISQGPSLCIFNKADPQEVLASWLFVEFLTTTPAFQADFSMTSGYVPVIKSAAEDAIYKSDFLELADGGDYIQALSVKVGLAQEAAYYTSPAFNGSSVARDQVGLLMQQCLSSKTDDVAKMIKKAFEDAIAECKYQAG